MRRLGFVISALLFVSACGHKNVQVKVPTTATASNSTSNSTVVASSELEGLASYYAEPYHGRKTASGEIFDTYQAMTAAHRTLPFNTMVRVTNTSNGRQVDVRINDRGPFVDGRVIDLSLRAAKEIDLVGPGVAPVKLTILKTQDAEKTSAFAVQVAAFENPEAAEGLKQQLQKKYPSVMIQTVSDERTLYRVRIGEPDMKAASKVASELKKDSFMPFVVRLE
jgi:rare lipoprotein A